MTDQDHPPEIIVDEDWKSQIERERATPASPEKTPQNPEELDYSQLPKADFSLLVSMFSTQALVSLGLIPEPGTGAPRTQLPLARHFIDLLGILEDKTKGNLSPEESNSLTENLHYLRMAFMEKSKGN